MSYELWSAAFSGNSSLKHTVDAAMRKAEAAVTKPPRYNITCSTSKLSISCYTILTEIQDLSRMQDGFWPIFGVEMATL
jgi:hypothetical protein